MNRSKSKGTWIDKTAVKESIKYNKINGETTKNLSNLNVNRGGTFGAKGFVGEHLAANEMNKKLCKVGLKAEVVNNNGLADIVVKNANGTIIKKYQAKFGYEGKNIDVSKYVADNQTILVSKDASEKFIRNLRSQGAKVERSNIITAEAEKLSKTMRVEGKILKNKNSTVAVKGYGFSKGIVNCHKAGVKSAGKGAAFGAGFSLANNTIDVINGDKEVEEAIVDIATDTVIAAGTGYVAGAAITAIGTTTTGAAIGTTIATAGTAITSTALGGAVVGGVTAASATITAGTAAVLGTGAIATATVVAAPIVAVGVVVGVIGTIFGSIFD